MQFNDISQETKGEFMSGDFHTAVICNAEILTVKTLHNASLSIMSFKSRSSLLLFLRFRKPGGEVNLSRSLFPSFSLRFCMDVQNHKV